MGRRVGAWAAMVAAGSLGVAPAQVLLRDGGEIDATRVLGVSLDGVEVRSDQGEPVQIDWSRVAEVRGEFAESAALFGEYAEKAWRARTRLARGDAVAAEPLFEELFTIYGGRQGATPAVVCEGLFRCRLRRGARAAAVQAWIGMLVAGEPGSASSLVDRETGLIPSLPPIWLGEAAAALLANEPWVTEDDEQRGAGAERAFMLLELYRAAAGESVGSDGVLPGADSSDFGVRLVRAMVLCQSERAEDRLAGRAALRVLREERPATWIESWADLGTGLSLVGNAPEDDRLRGVVSLLRVPALSARESPYLAGLGLAFAARALHDQGDARGAMRVLSELEVLFPGHPALRWEGLDAIRGRGAPGSAMQWGGRDDRTRETGAS